MYVCINSLTYLPGDLKMIMSPICLPLNYKIIYFHVINMAIHVPFSLHKQVCASTHAQVTGFLRKRRLLLMTSLDVKLLAVGPVSFL